MQKIPKRVGWLLLAVYALLPNLCNACRRDEAWFRQTDILGCFSMLDSTDIFDFPFRVKSEPRLNRIVIYGSGGERKDSPRPMTRRLVEISLSPNSGFHALTLTGGVKKGKADGRGPVVASVLGFMHIAYKRVTDIEMYVGRTPHSAAWYAVVWARPVVLDTEHRLIIKPAGGHYQVYEESSIPKPTPAGTTVHPRRRRPE